MSHDSSTAHAEHDHPTWPVLEGRAHSDAHHGRRSLGVLHPSFVASKAFVPALLIMSAVKFAIVVMFYMHLKYDHKLFRALFTGPLIIAMATILALVALLHKVSGA